MRQGEDTRLRHEHSAHLTHKTFAIPALRMGLRSLRPPLDARSAERPGANGRRRIVRTKASPLHKTFGEKAHILVPRTRSGRVTLDATDRKILRLLQEDARQSYRKIGDAVGLRPPSVHARVQRLEAEGYIRGYHADVDPEKIGRTLTAYVSIGLEGGRKGDVPRTQAIADQLRKDPDVVEVHAVTGEDDLLVKVRTTDIRGLERLLLRALEPLEGVRRTTTNIVVRSLIERAVAP